MKSFQYTITESVGIHARPAAKLVKTAMAYQSEIALIKGDQRVNAKKLLNVLGLAARCGETVTFEISGADEDEACAALTDFCNGSL